LIQSALRTVDARQFGVNTATWDSYPGNSSTLPLLQQDGITTLRWPGGSLADYNYHWYNDTTNNNTFSQLATNLDANVFITGENGTGKGLVALTLHSVSLRSTRPLVTVNTGGLAEGVFESELFGHVKGAFTDAKADRVGRFEMAEGGTLFLDEIANISQALQAKLLRTIEAGEFERVGSSKTRRVDVRVFSATNADLHAAVAEGRFRQDLLFRLNTIELRLPPLRDRREDIPVLASHFLRQHAEHYRKPLTGFDEGAVKALLAHLWPGNVRELDHAVERAVLMAQGETVRAADLGLRAGREGPPRIEEMSLEDVEALLIKKALARFNGNVSHAANALGLSRSALYRRLQRYGL